MLLKDLTILFVEDDKDTQAFLKQILEDDIKELYQAYDGEEALQVYKEKNPDIILADISLPLLSGLEFATIVKHINKEQPILFISAFDGKENLMQILDLGSDGFIKKPLDVEELYKKLIVIAEKINEKKRIYKLAHYDTLTHLPNRTMFEVELLWSIQAARDNNTQLALFFIDLDNFKLINDTFGHDVGDMVLQNIAKNISTVIPQNALLARRSGDEFLLLIKDYKNDLELQAIAQKIIDTCVKEERYRRNTTLAISCSIGISRFPKDGYNNSSLVRLADEAMYKAKQSGKSRYIFANKM